MPPRHPFPWPPIDLRTPHWRGDGFRVGNRHTAVLQYEAGPSGWSESLTEMHEQATNAGTHPIDVASRQRARALLKRYLRTPPAETVVLEAGCSSGYLLEELVSDWPESLVVGSDFIVGPLERLAKRMPQVPLLQFDLLKCPLPSSHVDAVTLLNVLEHIEDDAAAVAQVARILKPGGVAVFEVPAGPRLYDAYDHHLQHWRRYQLRDVRRLLRGAGLEVIESSHLGFFVYPAFAAVKLYNRWMRQAASEALTVQQEIRSTGDGQAGRLFRLAMTVERWLEPWVRYPVGIRCVVAARKGGP